jgi:predicted metal-dependent hydrolase
MNHSFAIGNLVLPIHIRRHPASRRMTIRYQPITHSIALTLPRYSSIRQGLSFVEEKRGWIEQRLREHPSRTLFADGQTIPFLGKPHLLKHSEGRGVVRVEDGVIIVPGAQEFMARRVREWLKREAMKEITLHASQKAQAIGKKIKKISLRDTNSRWGSCSASGNLSFSWRIVMAPPEVLDYLVSHEVAHLAHMNHSARFWQTVAMLCPGCEHYRHWLGKHGAQLYSYG